MESGELRYLIERLIEHNYIQTEDGVKFSYIGWACANAEKFILNDQTLHLLETMRQDADKEDFPSTLAWPPIWMETPNLFLSPDKHITGVLFFSPRHLYKRWRRSGHADESSMVPTWSRWQRELLGFNTKGQVVIDFAYQIDPKKLKGTWMFTSSHICPYDNCKIKKGKQKFTPCHGCKDILQYWSTWFPPAFHLVYKSSLRDLKRKSVKMSPLSHATTMPLNKTIVLISYLPSTKQQALLPAIPLPPEQQVLSSIPPTPVEQPNNTPRDQQKPLSETQVVQRPLVISRYISKQRERINQDTATLKQQQQAAQTEVAIDRSHKYLWMQSAWTMTEALRHNTDGTSLQLPENHVYIELEQPRQLHGQDIAAFSFFRQQEQCWTLSLIDPTGQTVWKAIYENSEWKLPHGYVCPQQACQTEKQGDITTYLLCSACQEHIHDYTSWITTALRMIHGDFQEEVEVKEPEYVVETTSKRVYDNEAKQVKNVKVRYRYRVIRYFDASRTSVTHPQTKRGSWMANRPIAKDANEVNPEAIIYVRIQPKEHDRTYRHQRYTNVRGKTQHIEPPPRLQPMTIATFRQLPRVQRVTRVLASKFEM